MATRIETMVAAKFNEGANKTIVILQGTVKKIVPITTGKKKKRLFLIRKKRERKVVAIATKPKRTPATTNRVVAGKRVE